MLNVSMNFVNIYININILLMASDWCM